MGHQVMFPRPRLNCVHLPRCSPSGTSAVGATRTHLEPATRSSLASLDSHYLFDGRFRDASRACSGPRPHRGPGPRSETEATHEHSHAYPATALHQRRLRRRHGTADVRRHEPGHRRPRGQCADTVRGRPRRCGQGGQRRAARMGRSQRMEAGRDLSPHRRRAQQARPRTSPAPDVGTGQAACRVGRRHRGGGAAVPPARRGCVAATRRGNPVPRQP